MIRFSWVCLYKGFIYNVNRKGEYSVFPLAVLCLVLTHSKPKSPVFQIKLNKSMIYIYKSRIYTITINNKVGIG